MTGPASSLARSLDADKMAKLGIRTSRCFHYGARDADEPRFQLMYGLTSVCRSDFSESYMALDRPPLEPGADGLRRLVLDREAG